MYPIMSSIPASEIKRRGISVVDEALKRGPVHVIQRNRPSYVILSEADYQRLVPQREGGASVWDFLAERSWRGTRTKADIDRQVAEERASWNKR